MGAKEISEREKNLERWCELESERCGVRENYGVYSGTFWVKRSNGHICYLYYPPGNSDLLLGALIESITARGWTAYTISGPLENRAEVLTQKATRMRQATIMSATANSPADALLSAYLQALEAKENS